MHDDIDRPFDRGLRRVFHVGVTAILGSAVGIEDGRGVGAERLAIRLLA